VNFAKLQGAGNDFVAVETSDEGRDWSRTAIELCDRHFGVGADGLILVLPSRKADVRMREFNPDGSEAEACGNGIRCLAKYVFEKGMVNRQSDRVSVETIAGIRQLGLFTEGNRLVSVQASMGKPGFNADEIPVTIEQGRGDVVYIKSMLSVPVHIDGMDMCLYLISMGNPHAVYFQKRPVSEFPLSHVGPCAEHLGIFPRRTNFEVVRVLERRQIEVRVWERGVGETLACGSGACAVAVAAQLCGYTESKVSVKLPGGDLDVEWDGQGEVLMRGPAEMVFTGEWPD
jgi:diaminopimelate epimerase